jgi:hypothetical protein
LIININFFSEFIATAKKNLDEESTWEEVLEVINIIRGNCFA